MMDRSDGIRALGGYLTSAGFEGRGLRFRLSWSELVWMVELDRIPRSERIGIMVGVCPAELAPDGWPVRANDCPIIFYPDGGGEPFGLDHWRAWQALDSSSDISDEDRLSELSAIVESIVTLANFVTTVDGLRSMAAKGPLRGFVRKDALSLIERGDEGSANTPTTPSTDQI